MPPVDRVLAFTVTAAVVIAIPGPSVLFIVGRALAAGRRTALLSVIGNTLGEYVQVTAVAFGVGALAQQSLVFLTVIKLVGGVYLLYLGIRTFQKRRELVTLPSDGDDEGGERWAVLRGAFVGVTNPKTVVFLAAILPQFATRSRGDVTVQILALGLLFSTIALVSDSGWALGAHGFRSWFVKSPRRLELVHGTGGIAIAAVGVAVLLTGRKD